MESCVRNRSKRETKYRHNNTSARGKSSDRDTSFSMPIFRLYPVVILFVVAFVISSVMITVGPSPTDGPTVIIAAAAGVYNNNNNNTHT